MTKTLRYILFPFAFIYLLITAIRNALYDLGVLKSAEKKLPLIGIGNLNTGGSGKTPMAEYLIRLLSDNFKTAYLSRGYKRSTSGHLEASNEISADEIGDEAFQIFKKWENKIVVSVNENRSEGIDKITKNHPDTQIVILDDVIQHRRINPGLKIVLSSYQFPFYKDFLLPAGNLRERRSGCRRAEILIITKCPIQFNEADRQQWILRVRKYFNGKIFFTGLSYFPLIAFKSGENIKVAFKAVLLVTGIVMPELMIPELKKYTENIETMFFPDHHQFGLNDILKINQKLKNMPKETAVVISEKDAARLKGCQFLNEDLKENLYVLPMEIFFLFDEENLFNQTILNYVNEFTGNS